MFVSVESTKPKKLTVARLQPLYYVYYSTVKYTFECMAMRLLVASLALRI